ncbi:hypothetical protein HG530_011325 [Fusarium avenaceum]|nr:hypothetical protein HG530_011325 [Fusarium avenaceum]
MPKKALDKLETIAEAQDSGVLLVLEAIPDKGSIVVLQLVLKSRLALIFIITVLFLLVVVLLVIILLVVVLLVAILLIGSLAGLPLHYPLAFGSLLLGVTNKFDDSLLVRPLLDGASEGILASC